MVEREAAAEKVRLIFLVAVCYFFVTVILTAESNTGNPRSNPGGKD